MKDEPAVKVKSKQEKPSLLDKIPPLPQSKGFWIFCLILMAGVLSSSKDVLIFAIIFGSISSWIFLPGWLRHKREMEKKQVETGQKDPQDQTRAQKLEDRLQNLEALICRLDSEMNYQLERTLSAGKIATIPHEAGVSQMPTTFMNVARALEDRYQILNELGRGGMGIVFQAYDKQLKEPVAIKILSPLLSNDADALERLKREVSAARRVTHKNVIRIHDLSEIKGLHYVSMEYFYGISLKDYIRKQGPLPALRAFDIASQVCDGLEAAHREGIIHRDLKSQNVIVDSSNRVKIIDFGLARTAHLDGMTATGLILGTPEYMAPEQVSGKKVDQRCDIYSFGIILYEMLTGRVPFTADSAIGVAFMQLKEDPPPPKEINPQITSDLERVILKALQKDPALRYSTIAEMKADLEQAVFASNAEIDLQKSVSNRPIQQLN